MEKSEVNLTKNNYKPIVVYDEMSTSYLSYAMSVIVSRALPDVRDGLKLYMPYRGANHSEVKFVGSGSMRIFLNMYNLYCN